ncbi:hypothetical protein Tco_1509124, partial [Tanacetum coccineum]
LSKRKFVIVCHEKVVEIPLEGSRKLRVQGERTLRAAKALMNAKVDEPKVGYISVQSTSVAKSPYRLAPLEMQELSEQLRELQDKGYPTRRSSQNLFYKIVKPITSPTERNQKYEWASLERKAAFKAVEMLFLCASIRANEDGFGVKLDAVRSDGLCPFKFGVKSNDTDAQRNEAFKRSVMVEPIASRISYRMGEAAMSKTFGLQQPETLA